MGNIYAYGEENLHSKTAAELKEIEKEQQISLINQGLKEVIYYRDFGKADKPSIWTVNLVYAKDGTVFARGVSVMSDKDNFRKVEGRVRARGRALRAVKRGRTSAEINIRDDNKYNTALRIADKQFGYKSSFSPELTKEEVKLVESAMAD